MRNTDASIPTNKRARTATSTPTAATPSKHVSGASARARATPPSTNKSAHSRLAILQGYTILVLPNVGIKHLPARLKAWIPGVQRLGGNLIQTYPPTSQEEHAIRRY